MHDPLVVSIPLVIGVVAAVRQATAMPARFLPLWSLSVGLVLALLFGGFTPQAVADGLVIGLSASGLYSGSKTLVQG